MASDDARTRLLQAAGPVFADKGYHAATVRDICLAAGTNVASVNYHFGDKENLYAETIKLARQARADRFPMPDWSPGTAASERLEDFVTTLLLRLIATDELSWNTRLMLREVVEPTGVCGQLVREYVRPLFHLLLEIVSELLPQSAPRHQVQQVAFSIVGQCLYYRVAQNVVSLLVTPEEHAAHFQPRQLAEHIVRFSLAALGVERPLGRTAGMPAAARQL
jgi:AcrR family transcriptional regulator